MVGTRHFHCQGQDLIPSLGNEIPPAAKRSQKRKEKKNAWNLKENLIYHFDVLSTRLSSLTEVLGKKLLLSRVSLCTVRCMRVWTPFSRLHCKSPHLVFLYWHLSGRELCFGDSKHRWSASVKPSLPFPLDLWSPFLNTPVTSHRPETDAQQVRIGEEGGWPRHLWRDWWFFLLFCTAAEDRLMRRRRMGVKPVRVEKLRLAHGVVRKVEVVAIASSAEQEPVTSRSLAEPGDFPAVLTWISLGALFLPPFSVL